MFQQVSQLFLCLNLKNLQVLQNQIPIIFSELYGLRCHEVCDFFLIDLHEAAFDFNCLLGGVIDDIFDHEIDESFFLFGLAAKQGIGFT